MKFSIDFYVEYIYNIY